jgi:glycogenin
MATIKLTCDSPKDPDEKLEELRRSSLVEFEHLKSAQSTSRKLSDRAMPEHSGIPVPHIHSETSTPSEPQTPKPPGLYQSPQLQQYPSITISTAADIQNQASPTEQSLFTEPDFNENVEMRKSSDAFSSEVAGEAETESYGVVT